LCNTETLFKSTGKGGSGVPNVVATAPMGPLASGGVKGLGTTCADHGNASVHIPHVLGPFHYCAAVTPSPSPVLYTILQIAVLAASHSSLPSRGVAHDAAGIRPRHCRARADARVMQPCPAGMSKARRKSPFAHEHHVDQKSPLARRRERPRAPCCSAPRCQAPYQGR
jgi:hypothetical protein